MCVLARVFEDAGLTTTSIALLMPPVLHVKPPRALVVPFPYGYALGKPNDPIYQHRVLGAALELLDSHATPLVAEFPDKLDGPIQVLQASTIQQWRTSPSVSGAANEIIRLRVFYERWLAASNGRTAVGLSEISPRRFRGAVRFLEAHLKGEEPDHPQCPAGVTRLQFVRRIVDDLKAFAYEARMAQRPNDDEATLHSWFWGDTSLGVLIKSLADEIALTGDERQRLIAGGIAR